MNVRREYRDRGAIGALLDEYEKGIEELILVIGSLSMDQMSIIVDKETDDPDCVSVISILNHVIRAAHNYTIAIRKHCGEQLEYCSTPKPDDSKSNYPALLRQAFRVNVKLFDDYPDITLVEKDNNKKILTSWGQCYDVDQLMEHAIVHVLRHRRQIERFILRMKN